MSKVSETAVVTDFFELVQDKFNLYIKALAKQRFLLSKRKAFHWKLYLHTSCCDTPLPGYLPWGHFSDTQIYHFQVFLFNPHACTYTRYQRQSLSLQTRALKNCNMPLESSATSSGTPTLLNLGYAAAYTFCKFFILWDAKNQVDRKKMEQEWPNI